jgi:hypothetical protein
VVGSTSRFFDVSWSKWKSPALLLNFTLGFNKKVFFFHRSTRILCPTFKITTLVTNYRHFAILNDFPEVLKGLYNTAYTFFSLQVETECVTAWLYSFDCFCRSSWYCCWLQCRYSYCLSIMGRLISFICISTSLWGSPSCSCTPLISLFWTFFLVLLSFEDVYSAHLRLCKIWGFHCGDYE